MNTIQITVLAVLALAANVSAAEKRGAWPKRVSSSRDLQFASVATAALPSSLRVQISATEDVFGVADEIPKTLEVARIDLNGDGRVELFVESRLGGTGGTHHFIYEITDSRCREIGGLQGGFYLCERRNGYYQIEVWGRAGGMQWSRLLLRYDRGRYRIVRAAEYRGYDESDAKFVREYDPKDNQP